MTVFLEITAKEDMCFELRWQVRELTGRAEVVFASPLTASTAQLLFNYVRDFRSWRRGDLDHAHTAERTLLTLGRALGSALTDSEYRLLTFCDALERAELPHVTVRSDSPAVMAIPWETLILPDSSYCLAASSASFIRTPHTTPELQRAAESGNGRLGYLRLGGDAVSQAWRQNAWQGALSFRWHAELTPARLEELRRTGPWQIVHWTADVAQPIAAETLHALGTRLLIVEPRVGSAAADELACALLQAGVENVIVVARDAEQGWPSDWAEQLLDCVGHGFGLQQAVVETRKRLQRALIEARQAEPARQHAPQLWHALRHYSARDVRFFAEPVARVSWEASPGYGQLRQKLFGFDANMLPPTAADLGDRSAVHVLEQLNTHNALLVTGVCGAGLTHTLHRAALLAVANADVERAYFWDFEREAFAVEDVLEMVAGVHGQTDPSQVTEQSVLGLQRELFVFDNLERIAGEHRQAVLALAERIAQRGSMCLIGAHELSEHRLAHWQLPQLTELEQIALVSTRAPQLLAPGVALPKLLEQLQGNPHLISCVVAGCDVDKLAALISEASAHYGATSDPAEQVQRFYAQRWQQLEPHWQLLTRAWLPLGTLYLQTLMVGVDQPAGERSELWELLGAPAADSCASAITRLQALGFAAASGAGTRIDRAAQRFIREQSGSEERELEQALASALCAGALRVIERGTAQGRDMLSAHLLEHRVQLRRQIDLVLQIPHYGLGIRTFLQLHRLLLQANATREASAWADELLTAVGPALLTQGTAWLMLALRAPIAPPSAELLRGAQHWHQLLLGGELAAGHVPMVVAVLQKLYDQTGDHTAYQAITRATCALYRAAGDTTALAAQLASLAAVEHVLGDSAARDELEHELLHGVSYPADSKLRAQAFMQVGTMRLRRGDSPGVVEVVQLLEREPQAPSSAALQLRAALAYSAERWEQATELYCQIWAAAIGGGVQQAVDIDATANALSQLKSRIGTQRFIDLYERYAGSTPTPEALGIVIR